MLLVDKNSKFKNLSKHTIKRKKVSNQPKILELISYWFLKDQWACPLGVFLIRQKIEARRLGNVCSHIKCRPRSSTFFT